MGVTFNEKEQSFVFDFELDVIEYIVRLTVNVYQIESFGKCFYYGYEFSGHVTGTTRGNFIKYLKFQKSLRDNPNLTKFIKKAVDNLNAKVNLYDYDLVIMPESSSKVNEFMLRYIYRFAQPMLREIELVKALPANISFDMDTYERQ